MTTTDLSGRSLPYMEVLGPYVPGQEEVLTTEALQFLADLHTHFAGRRHDLLCTRQRRREQLSAGADPKWSEQTAHIRGDRTWRVAGAGPGLDRRHVELTGPPDPKMTVNALNSAADVWLADLEDATSPTWHNIVGGQLTLIDALRHRLHLSAPEGKRYSVPIHHPTIVMRPRGWHLCEKHIRYVDRAGQASAASASLVDFGLYFFHNANLLVEHGRGPYFYLPKLESSSEARFWNDIFCFAQDRIGLPRGTIRATVLIETITAAFEMEEILYELREHCAGLNAGRWDYIFSVVKNFSARGPRYLLPDRSTITMTVPFMRAYTELLVATCHRRGAHAIGGMSAFIPNRRQPVVTATALEQVSIDKQREAEAGFDGTWVAHPDLIRTAAAAFQRVLSERPNQLSRQRPDVKVTAADLLDFASASGAITDAGLRSNVSVCIRYIESWLRGVGAAAIDNLMEDTATAEICRALTWQWVHNAANTVEGTTISRPYVEQILAEFVATVPAEPSNRFGDAADVFREVALAPELPSFLTIIAYPRYLVPHEETPRDETTAA